LNAPGREEFWQIGGTGKVVFYVLIFLSLAIMAFQIAQRVRLWLKGKPTVPTLREGLKYWIPTPYALKKWLVNLWSYVLLQRKVKTSRKRSGAPMHLLIFYGFLALFIATTILAIDSYGPFHFHQGTFYLVYETTFDLLGLLFVIGVGWAFFRRLKMAKQDIGKAKLHEQPETEADKAQYAKQTYQNRRQPLSSFWTDYATLGLLFIIGVTGYLLEAARISANPQPFDASSVVGYSLAQLMPGLSVGGYQFIWWFHMVWVAVFFAALPQMRIRHIVMAIASTAGKPEQPMGELKPISMEEVEQTEKIGVSHAQDYSRWHLMSLDACMECGRCTEVCPAWKVGKVLNPKQVVQDLRGAMVSGTTVAEAVSEEALWACTTCNACVEACPVLIRHVDLIVDARRNLVAEGRLSGPAATMLRQTASTSNAWGKPAAEREDWMKDLDIPLCRDGVDFEYLFWVGCAGATDPGAIKTTKAVAELLKKAGVKFACLGREEACTGDPARRVGDEFLYQDKATQNISVFERYKVKKVVTPCPHCFNTLKNEYGQFGAQLEVVHHSQLLQQLVSKGDLVAASPNRGDVTFHDPCYLARINNESDAPREALGQKSSLNDEVVLPDPNTQGGNLAEPAQYARKTLCCGAGGGRMWMEEPPTQRPANNRAQQLIDTGAKTVAVGCPFCRIMLGDSLKQVTTDEIRLVDLAEMLQEANASKPADTPR
jgi:Fe-S oxidoreductase